MNHRQIALFSIFYILFSSTVVANTLQADFRHRPPEMTVETENYHLSGPLKDVMDQAAARLGHTIEWRVVPFIRSLHNLRNHKTDIVPRVIHTQERTAFIDYIGPIAMERHDIYFLTRSNGPQIAQYQDLKSLQIGVKRGTVYFEKFDQDTTLNKITVADDFNLARMLRAGRIDAAIVLDMPAMLAELQTIDFNGYQQSEYVYPNEMGNYYGMPLNHPQARAFNQTLAEMKQDGTIDAIYHRYGLSLMDSFTQEP